MPARAAFEYAVVRVVPCVEREEFVNVGAILFCDSHDFLAARVELDVNRLLAMAPETDVDLVERHLAALPRVCSGGPEAGPIGQLTRRERFRWLVAPRSGLLQTSPAHSGLCVSPAEELDRLFDRLVRPRQPPPNTRSCG